MIWTAWIVKKQWMWTLGGGGGRDALAETNKFAPGNSLHKKKKNTCFGIKKKKILNAKIKNESFSYLLQYWGSCTLSFFKSIPTSLPHPPPDLRLFFSLLSFPSAYIFGFFVAVFKCFYFSKTIKALNRGKH